MTPAPPALEEQSAHLCKLGRLRQELSDFFRIITLLLARRESGHAGLRSGIWVKVGRAGMGVDW